MVDITDTEARKMGLPSVMRDRWAEAAKGKLDDLPGALSELIAELYDWVSETPLLSPEELSKAEAVETRKELANLWALESDAEGELYRVRVLGLGADRTAQEVLEDLVGMEREAEDWANIEREES